MDLAQIKRDLQDKERDLVADIARLEQESRTVRDVEVQDPIDVVTSSERQAAALQESTLEWQTLRLVREALQRIERGTYGKCIDCGRPVEEARLRAVPWAQYCLHDQERHDRDARNIS